MPQTTLLTYLIGSINRSATPSTTSKSSYLESSAISRQPNENATFSGSNPCSFPCTLRQSPELKSRKVNRPSQPLSDCLEEELTFDNIRDSDLPAIQRLTSTLLPIRYPTAFFKGSVDDPFPAVFSRVARDGPKPIGWIRCRLDSFPESTCPPSSTNPITNRVYIQALCLLAPYRGLGIATRLLDDILDANVLREHDVDSIYAHVWESNEDALQWYEHRGFDRVMLIESYYRKLNPKGAWIMRKELR